MLIAVLIAALVGLFLFDTVRLRRMQVQRDAAVSYTHLTLPTIA